MEADDKEEEREAKEALPSTLFIYIANKPMIKFKTKGRTVYIEYNGFTFTIKLVEVSVGIEEWKWKVLRGEEHLSSNMFDSLEDAIEDITRDGNI